MRKGKRVICGPTSLKKVSTLWALMPGMVVKSTPRMRGASRRDIEEGLIALSFVFGGGSLRALLLGIEA